MTHKVVFGQESKNEGAVGSHHTILHLLSSLTESCRGGGGGGVKPGSKLYS